MNNNPIEIIMKRNLTKKIITYLQKYILLKRKNRTKNKLNKNEKTK